ncbi:MAG: helix-turn-helix transcriptional regulator [Clostridium sp.]
MTPQEKLKALRKEKKLTTQQLGELCGMLQPTISKLENGKRKMDLETLNILAKALNVSINEFFDNGQEKTAAEEIMNSEDKQELCQSGINIFKDYEEKELIQQEEAGFKEMDEKAEEDDDITQELNVLMQKFYSNKGGPLFFNGAPLDGEVLEELEESLKFAIRGLKQKNLKRKQQ